MARRPYLLLRLLLPAVFLLLGCPPPGPAPERIALFGLGAYLTPGSEAHFLAVLPRSFVGDGRAERPLAVGLQEADGSVTPLYRGRTDATGAAEVVFDVPPATEISDPNATLVLSLEADSDSFTSEHAIYIGDINDVLLTTDKPVYQPGQVLHLRGLALNRATMQAAADQPIQFVVVDPAGNRLLSQEVTSSSFGIAAADFPLSEQAPSGNYTIEAHLGAFSVSDSVEVKPYTLPRFKVEFNPARSWYLPGEVVTGTVSAQYFFGKPVAGGTVSLRGVVTDVEQAQVVDATGTTDASGIFTFTFAMPSAFAATSDETEQGVRTAKLNMTIEVTDKAQHLERIEEEITATETPLLIDVAPETGDMLVRGTDNIVYINVTTPDGTAAQANLWLTSAELARTITATTDISGLAAITFTAAEVEAMDYSSRFSIHAVAVDDPALGGTRRIWLPTSPGLLLRPNAAEYAVGDTLHVDAFAPAGVDAIYLSVEKNGESHAFATLPVQGGVAQGELLIDGALLGTLSLGAYGVDGDGVTYKATRLVLVNPAPALLDVQADAEVYRPGELATVDVQVTHAGDPLPAALGVSVVDESVFALGESDPGFARTYFLLARTLQDAQFGISGFAELKDAAPSPYDADNTNTVIFRYASAQSDSRRLALSGYLAQQGEIVASGAPSVPGGPGASGAQWGAAWGYAKRLPLALPLIGLALYDGTRKRRRLLFGLLIAALATFVLVSCAAPAAAPAAPASGAPAAEAAAPAPNETTAPRGGAAPPRLRQFFPETLLWLPEVMTDAAGHAQIQAPLADTITTWRMSIVASDRAGNLGSATLGLRAFQDFFVEPDLPTRLTVDDELELPVSIYNYSDSAQDVALRVAPAAWFTLTAPISASVSVAANDVTVAYIPMRVTGFGAQTLRIDAQSATLADAVARAVTIVPNGEALAQSSSGLLIEAAQTLTATLAAQTLPGTGAITIKIFPDTLSQMSDGFESLLQEPHGCFEQVTSTLYPALLALEALRDSDTANPALEQRGSMIVRSGYQQLLNYEVDGAYGGFSYWGDPPPSLDLSAYGLMQFTDMARVAYVDPALIERTANFVMAQQQADGSWPVLSSWGGYSSDPSLRSTAWVVWALADAGYTDTLAVQNGLAFLRARQGLAMLPAPFTAAPAGQSGASSAGQPRPGQTDSPLPPAQVQGRDAYTLATMANAFLAAGEDATPYLDALAALGLPGAQALNPYGLTSAGVGTFWTTDGFTWTGADGYWADIDASALATFALARDPQHRAIALDGLRYLLSQRNPSGAIGTTQATVFTLKSLLALSATTPGASSITFTLDSGAQQVVELPAASNGVVQEVYFAGLDAGAHSVTVAIDGPQRPAYQLIASSYQPWRAPNSRTNAGVKLEVAYDRTEMEVNDQVFVTATVELLTPGGANMLLVRLPVPPGFEAQRDDWRALRSEGAISDYEIGAHEVLVYLSRVVTNQPIAFNYRLQARLPVRATAAGATAYDFYRPDKQDASGPVQIIVRRIR